ncbi:MAG: type I DNA topoisomerase, partial [Myxococcota bacterium]
MAKSLVIVESPAKARTIAGFLGERFVVESSIGHIRDLPKRASDVPAELKKDKRSREVARLGVDVENDFKPLYIVDEEKKSHITRLKALLKEADELLLATDEDREGEAIAWHLSEVLRPKVPVKRMVFHEITKKAIQHALDHPRDIDRHLVDAQEARRILDRLYGYEVSPVLWKKVMPGLSAGRVQSVATRVIVARERERIRFQSAKYWDINGNFLPDTPSSEAAHQKIEANLISVSGQRLATSKDFDDLGRLSKDVLLLDELQAKELKSALDHGTFQVRSVERKPYKRAPAAPFMTSTLQQESGRKLRFSSSRTMKAAQRLYESGYITYMRTDSTTLSDSALTAARSHIEGLYGAHYLPEQPRLYRKKVKNAQEAHEAIRPAGDSFRLPAEVAKEVGPDEAKLYELVWKRTVASQMKDAVGHRLQVRISGAIKRNGVPDSVEFSTSGLTITFPGFLRAYVEGSDDPEAELENRERPLPPVQEGESLAGQEFKPVLHETQPRARFTEASLVRRLEELGVGRPSTYASIISTILAREYAWKRGTALVPSFKAFAVITLLEQHFGGLVDYAFTARMEDQLDAIARGDEATVPWLRRFYFGGGLPANTNDGCQGDGQPTELGVFHGTSQGGESAVVSGAPQAAVSESRVSLDAGLRALVSSNLQAIDARAVNTIVLGEDKDGLAIQVRVGRKFGPYLVRGEDTAQIPEKMPP